MPPQFLLNSSLSVGIDRNVGNKMAEEVNKMVHNQLLECINQGLCFKIQFNVFRQDFFMDSCFNATVLEDTKKMRRILDLGQIDIDDIDEVRSSKPSTRALFDHLCLGALYVLGRKHNTVAIAYLSLQGFSAAQTHMLEALLHSKPTFNMCFYQCEVT